MYRKEALCVIVGCLFSFMSLSGAWAADTGEEFQYRRIKLDNVSCDVGISYRKAPYGMDIAVSAIALGKFQDFRHWRVEKIKLRLGDARVRPDKCEKFFVRKSSFWKYPAAVLWAVIGSQYTGLKDYGTLAEGIGKIGMAVGLGILTLQAKGDIPGEICTFYLKGNAASSISYGADSVRIDIRNQDTNETEHIAVTLTRPSPERHDAKSYSRMSKDELSSKLSEIDGRIAALEYDLEACKSGRNFQCTDIQSKIEFMREEQAIAYKAWSEK